jgi:hypothetical protein
MRFGRLRSAASRWTKWRALDLDVVAVLRACRDFDRKRQKTAFLRIQVEFLTSRVPVRAAME